MPKGYEVTVNKFIKSQKNPKVVNLSTITSLDIPADRVIAGAIENGLKSIIIVGVDLDDDFYFASSIADGADVLWWLEVAKKRLMTDA